MERMKASDFPPEVLKLFDGYVHGCIDRREFLDRAAKYRGRRLHRRGDAREPAAQLRVGAAGRRRRRAHQGGIPDLPVAEGHRARCAATSRGRRTPAGKLPGVVVIHENRGLNPYIEDVARRLAVEGYVAFAPDALTPVGGYPGDEEKAAQLFASLDPAKRTEDLLAAVPFLKSRPDCNGKVGAVGFCFGGGIVNTIAVRIPDLAAAVPFYGRSRAPPTPRRSRRRC